MLWEDLEGAGGEGGGRGDRDGEDMWTQGLFISIYDKIHYKKKKKKKKMGKNKQATNDWKQPLSWIRKEIQQMVEYGYIEIELIFIRSFSHYRLL